jgi:hypothetical protein
MRKATCRLPAIRRTIRGRFVVFPGDNQAQLIVLGVGGVLNARDAKKLNFFTLVLIDMNDLSDYTHNYSSKTLSRRKGKTADLLPKDRFFRMFFAVETPGMT